MNGVDRTHARLADSEQDVPYTEDLQSPAGARAWADAADEKRPQRRHVRQAIADEFQALAPGSRVLELGSGPGLLAEHVLRDCTHLGRYTLFDFSEPMLAMSRDRVGRFPSATFVLGDFRMAGWSQRVAGPYEAVISMQAVHEVRHKRHVPGLYRQVYGLLVAAGLFLMSDRVPEDESPRSTALFMTEQEHLAALTAAGFVDARLLMSGDALILFRCTKPARSGSG
ncbi:MAG: class I SAM-dependent methyltransferase [Vicinamibacterales bacterium]